MTDPTSYTLYAHGDNEQVVQATLKTPPSKPISFMASAAIVVGGRNSDITVGD